MMRSRDKMVELLTVFLRGNKPFAEAVYDSIKYVLARYPYLANDLLPNGYTVVLIEDKAGGSRQQ